MAEIDWLKDFAEPPARCGHQMFWSWNTEVTERRITEMLEQFAERGIGGVLVHPRPGMITEYLSERYFALWRHALGECGRLGLECHIYDENAFPSGSAGGLVLAERPDLAAQVLRAELHTEAPVSPDGELLAAYRPGAEPERLPEGADLGKALADGPVVTLSLERGGRRAYPDLSRPEVTRLFLRLTHEQYARRFAEHFGREIAYAFADEPGVTCRDGLVLSDYLLEEFRAEHGYDLTDRLDAFLADGPEAEAVRFDYFRTLNRLWVGNFARAIYAWCDEHGLAFTGHYNEHEWPAPETVPDAMWGQRWMQAPGIDLLGFQFDETDRAANALYLLTMKEAASVGNQLGAESVFCEAYGARGYEMAIPELKPLSDWLLACGINVIDPHLSHMSIAGARKYEWPQTISDHASWWPCYGIQARHDARATLAVTQGRARNRVLLLHPTLSGWLHYLPRSFRLGEGRGEARIGRLRESQSAVVQALADGQVDFDLGDELIMAELGRLEGGELRVGEGRYRLLVLPQNMETWLGSTRDLVEQFLRAGGTLLALGDPPARLEGRPSEAPAALAAAFPDGWVRCADMADLVGRARELVPPRWSRPDGSPLPPEITCHRRECADGRAVHLFVNPWREEVGADVRLEGGSLLALDTLRGRTAPVATEPAGDGQVVRLELPPSGHALFVSEPERREVAAPPQRAERPVALGEVSAERLAPNVLVLDYCDMAVRGTEGREGEGQDVNVTRANRIAWGAVGFERDPWHRTQLRRELIDLEFPAETDLELRYPFVIRREALEAVAGSLQLAVERPWLYAVEVNGRAVEFPDGARWWDEDMRRAAIGESVRPGRNAVTLRARPFHVLCEVAPLYVLGEFALQPAARGFEIAGARPLGLGDWRGAGLLFYPWGVRYRAGFELEEPAEGLTVRLPAWEGSAARVLLDGERAGCIAYPPHELEVERAVAAGAHELAVDLFGNMKNILGPPFSEGLPGVWSWEEAPDHCPPGSRYRFFPCGLTAAPSLTARQSPPR